MGEDRRRRDWNKNCFSRKVWKEEKGGGGEPSLPWGDRARAQQADDEIPVMMHNNRVELKRLLFVDPRLELTGRKRRNVGAHSQSRRLQFEEEEET